MRLDQVVKILQELERQLQGLLSPEAEAAVQKLLNLVEQLVVDQRGLLAEVQRLRDLLEQKKRNKTTASGEANPLSPIPPKSSAASVSRPRRDPRTIGGPSKNLWFTKIASVPSIPRNCRPTRSGARTRQ